MDGWKPSHGGAALEFVGRWAAALNAACKVTGVGKNSLSFTLDIDDISLRGMNSKPCLLLAGAADESWAEELRKLSSPQQIPFLLALSEVSYERASGALRGDRFLLLAKEDVLGILRAAHPPTALKQVLLRRVPRRALIPYNVLTPAEGNMFFGRLHELERLDHEHFVSFAIAGPGRIGKTSLLQQYKALKLRQRVSGPLFFISFFACDPFGDSVARYLAMQIDSSSRSNRMTADGLLDFLKYQAKLHGDSLELLLDEVDLVCQSDAFKALGAAARMGLCRLVLSGKGALLKMILSQHSLVEGRLDLITLRPLDDSSARTLLLKPLGDLGFSVTEPDALAAEVLSLTGRLPHLLQLVCQKLVDLALVEQTDTISARHVEQLKGDFLIAQSFLLPLVQLEDPLTRLVALLMLARGRGTFGVREVKEEASGVGLDLDERTALEVCNDLVINNVLSWGGAGYVAANEGLYYYAGATGYLDSALEETLVAVKERRR